jgi:hypothetical protein
MISVVREKQVLANSKITIEMERKFLFDKL